MYRASVCLVLGLVNWLGVHCVFTGDRQFRSSTGGQEFRSIDRPSLEQETRRSGASIGQALNRRPGGQEYRLGQALNRRPGGQEPG
jgi:hypothetical protein